MRNLSLLDCSRLIRTHCKQRLAVSLALAIVLPLSTMMAPASHGARDDTRAEKFLVVDCLLPGQLRRLGGMKTYLTPRRPVKTTASDCEIRGGEYTAYDRANYATALKVWLPTAKEGDPQAQTNVGEIFEKGLGTLADYQAAAAWYNKAAQQGYSRAMLNLGYLYEKGLGVEQNMREALNWYRRASGLTDDDLEFASSLQVTVAAKDREIANLQQESESNRREMEQMRTKLEQAQAGLSDQQKELEQTRNRLSAIRAQLKQQDREGVVASEADLDQRRAELDAEQAQLAQRQQELQGLETRLKQQAANLSSQQRDVAERNAELQAKLLAAEAAGDRLRKRLQSVNDELSVARDNLRGTQTKDAGLIAQLNAVEQERQQLKTQLQDSDATIASLRDGLEDAKRQLDEGGARYAQTQQEFSQNQSLYEAERRQLQEERDMLASTAKMLAKTSQKKQAQIKKLREELEAQEVAYASRLRDLNAKYADSKARLESMQSQLKKGDPGPSTTVAAAEAPTIELIEPPVTLTRGAYTATVLAGIDKREVIGRVTAPAGLMSFNVNDAQGQVSDNGLFSFTVPVREQRESVKLVAVDKLGQRVTLDFDLARPAQAQAVNTKTVKQKKQLRVSGLGEYYALVIGNNKYDYMPNLKTPVSDAQAVADLLQNQYGYKTTVLFNANRYAILSALNELRAQLSKNDNLLIYYAGHGEIDEVNGQGYWLPVDAEQESTANWISTRSISDTLNAMAAKHVLVVADSCYSGAMTRSALARLQAGKTVNEWEKWFSKMAKSRTRMVLSSGGEEPVNDGGGGKHSIFAKAFMKALKENGRCLDGYSLYTKVARYVRDANRTMDVKQTPQYAPIKYAGHEAGEFLFQPI